MIQKIISSIKLAVVGSSEAHLVERFQESASSYFVCTPEEVRVAPFDAIEDSTHSSVGKTVVFYRAEAFCFRREAEESTE